MLLRNESSTDMSLVAMLASCSPVALQGLLAIHMLLNFPRHAVLREPREVDSEKSEKRKIEVILLSCRDSDHVNQ